MQSTGVRKQPPSMAAEPNSSKRRKTDARVETPGNERVGAPVHSAAPLGQLPKPAVGRPQLPRLEGHCEPPYVPCNFEEAPSKQLSREFHWLLNDEESSDDEDAADAALASESDVTTESNSDAMVASDDDSDSEPDFESVSQSHGAASYEIPLISFNFRQCACVILRNVQTGEFLLIHHDSGVRSEWTEAMSQKHGLPPTSPCTPDHGLIARKRCGYAEFMARAQPGQVQALFVEGPRAYDRREFEALLAKDGVEILPPLRIKTTAAEPALDRSAWDITLRPKTGELILHVHDISVSVENEKGKRKRQPKKKEILVDHGKKVLHFRDVFPNAAPYAAARAREPVGRPVAKPDIASHFYQYQDRVRQAVGLSQADRRTVESCLNVVGYRNFSSVRAIQELEKIIETPGIPRKIRRILQDAELSGRDGLIVSALTELVERLLASSVSPAH